MAQELTSGLGRPLTWRDKIRNYMRERYGEQGAQLAEGLIGVSEEEQQMRSLQRRYGSELPEDAALDRPMRERFTDPSDLGGIDKLLMALSGTASVAPRLATTASATESAALLGDAQGSYKKGDKVGAGLQTGLALLPMGLGMLGREVASGGGTGLDDLLPKPQTEVSMAGTPYTMSVADEPLYFSKQTGRMGGGGGGMSRKPLDKVYTELDKAGKEVDEFGESYDAFQLLEDWPKEYTSAAVPPVRRVIDAGIPSDQQMFHVDAKSHRIDDYDIQSKGIALENKHFEDHGFSKNDALMLSDDSTPRAVTELLDELKADPGSIKEYRFITEDGEQALEELITYTVDGVPVTSGFLSDPYAGGYSWWRVPSKNSLSKLDEIETEEVASKISNTFNSRQYPGHFTDKVSTGNGVSATVKGDRGVSGAEVVDNIVKDLQQSGVTGDDFLSNQPFSSPVRMEGVLDGEKIMFSSTPIGSDSYEVSIRSLGKDKITGRTRLDEIETEEANLLKTQRLMETANKDVGSQTLNDPNFESLTPSEQRNLLRTQNLMRNEKEIRSLEDQLYMKNAIRNQEGHLMSTNNLTKLTNEIDALEARINALKGE